MQKINIAALFVAASAVSATAEIKTAKVTDAYLDGSNGGMISIISANTNRGKSNGGEMFMLMEVEGEILGTEVDTFAAAVITGGEEGDANINAFEPATTEVKSKKKIFGITLWDTTTTTTIATDPGNSGGGGKKN